MLIEFQVSNYRSFRDLQKLSMLAAPKRPNDHGLEENNVFESHGLRLLKTKAIYGANASGKSNILSALMVFNGLIGLSVQEEKMTKGLWSMRYKLLLQNEENPMSFQIIFTVKEKIYRYGFQILNEIIHREWLVELQGNLEAELFSREVQKININEDFFTQYASFIESAERGEHELFRSDSLFLSAGALNGSKLLMEIRNEIQKIKSISDHDEKLLHKVAKKFLANNSNEISFLLKEFMHSADTSIEDLKVIKKDLGNDSFSQDNDADILVSHHKRFDTKGNFIDVINTNFDLWESEGTKKILGIGTAILASLNLNETLSIDEFDARLHPNLTLKIVNLFNNLATNPKNAQLIFVSHDTGLLRRANLRRDQICFVSKNKFGASTIHTLIEYKGVRKDSSYEKEYLNGSYSAVPYLDDMDELIMNQMNNDGLQETK